MRLIKYLRTKWIARQIRRAIRDCSIRYTDEYGGMLHVWFQGRHQYVGNVSAACYRVLGDKIVAFGLQNGVIEQHWSSDGGLTWNKLSR